MTASMLRRFLLGPGLALAAALLMVVVMNRALPARAAETAGSATVATSGFDSSPAVVIRSLRQAERLALENNLNLRAQGYSLLAAETVVRKNLGIYDPQLGLDLSQVYVKDRLNVLYASDRSKANQRQFNLSLSQLIPTGGQLALAFTNERMSSDPSPAINPYYDSEVRLSLAQPLLRNFGTTVTEQNILFAIKDRQRSVQDLRNQAFSVLSDVRDAYFEVLRSRDELAFRRTSLELAQRILKENRARVDAGVMAPIDILEAEVGVKQRERDLLDAERLYRDALDGLGLLLDVRGNLEVGDEALSAPEFRTDAEAGFRAALTGRPDIQQQLRALERLQIEQQVAHNSLLPSLDLSAAYSQKGLGSSYRDDLDDIGAARFPNWQVGVSVSYPLGNRTARNEILRNRVRKKNLEAQLGQLHESIRKDIRSAIRLLDISRKKIDVAASGSDLAEEKLRTLLKRKEVGLATTRDVLQGEDDLAAARTAEFTAYADYNKALTSYLRVTGQLLSHEKVVFTGELDPGSEAPLLKMHAE